MKDYSIRGISTIKQEVFKSALAHRRSPVINFSVEEYYNLIRGWRINPAVALGFFVNESSCGTRGKAVETLNWGNLREGPGELYNKDGFAFYASWLVGLNDWCKLLTGPLYEGVGLLTVSQVTPKYAPSLDENDPRNYAAVVNFLCLEWENV